MNIIKVLVLIVFWFACVTLSLAHHHGKDSNEKNEPSNSDQQQISVNSISSPQYKYLDATTEMQAVAAKNYTYFNGREWVTSKPQSSPDTENSQNSQNVRMSENSENSVQQSQWPETSINAEYDIRANHIEQVNDGQLFNTNPILDLLALNRWRTMFQRGREMMQQLPSMGLMAGDKIISDVPTPMEIFHYSKQTLLALPNEVFAYVVDSVCKCAANIRYANREKKISIFELYGSYRFSSGQHECDTASPRAQH